MGVLLFGGSSRARLAAEMGDVGVRETIGHGGRGKRDDQGQGDQKLLHSRSPSDVAGLGIWKLRPEGQDVRPERLET